MERGAVSAFDGAVLGAVIGAVIGAVLGDLSSTVCRVVLSAF